VEKAIETAKLKKENAELKVKAKVSDDILGQSQSILILKQTIEKIAPLNGRCVILGPAGSDKEAIAREIHRLSPRAKNPFGAISCQSYTTSQLEIELFGIFINNFGEIKMKHGILERTNGGTLFINDLSNASSEIQMKVLKTLKEKTFFRIGSNEKIPLTARIIAGFPPNINELIKEGLFSDELFCRLNANMLKILPLASRREDVTILLNHYMEQSAKAHNARIRKFSTEAIGVLSSYSWPGDVMQLKNFVDWTLTINLSSKTTDGSIITIEDLPKEIVEGTNSSEGSGLNFISMFSELSIKDAREEFERQYFLEQLKRFSGNVSQTAKFVCMERSALHRKLKSLNITNSQICKLNSNE
ncbi:MAG: sigma 54-interacting transcriptional regulator, partial [Holosporales bacterium]|nr:sigma 54-interacting transcriptional regulator [Holosporales bacterium]